METTKEIIQNPSKTVNIDSLDEKVKEKYPSLAEISAELTERENEVKGMVHAFYERQKGNVEVGEEKGQHLNDRFIKILREKKRLEQLAFQEKVKTPEYQEMFASLHSKKRNAKD